jgi:hypothetical protein
MFLFPPGSKKADIYGPQLRQKTLLVGGIPLMADYHCLGFATAIQGKEPKQQAGKQGCEPNVAHPAVPIISQVADENRTCFSEKVHSVTDRIDDYVSLQRHRVIHEKSRYQKDEQHQAKYNGALEREEMRDHPDLVFFHA